MGVCAGARAYGEYPVHNPSYPVVNPKQSVRDATYAVVNQSLGESEQFWADVHDWLAKAKE